MNRKDKGEREERPPIREHFTINSQNIHEIKMGDMARMLSTRKNPRVFYIDDKLLSATINTKSRILSDGLMIVHVYVPSCTYTKVSGFKRNLIYDISSNEARYTDEYDSGGNAVNIPVINGIDQDVRRVNDVINQRERKDEGIGSRK